jgi:NAD+ kinase
VAVTVRTVGIIAKPHREDIARIAGELADWFERRGIGVLLEQATARAIDRAPLGWAAPEIRERAELIVVVGGDGTLLAAARVLDGRDTPVLGINHGSLGFLTAVRLDRLYPDVERTLRGECTIDRRGMIDASVWRGQKRVVQHRALNDVVVNKGTPARLVEVEARVDDQYVSTFRADGLIVATPTGSTAYNLSAGGPILHPGTEALVISPICSHTLTNRPIVLPSTAIISITFGATDDDEEVYATIDGQVAVPMEPGDRLVVAASAARLHLVGFPGTSYFDVLRGKLKWG